MSFKIPEAASSKYEKQAQNRVASGSGVHLNCLFLGRQKPNTFSANNTILLFDPFNAHTTKRKRKANNMAEDPVETSDVSANVGDIVRISTPNSTFTPATTPTGCLAELKDFSATSSLEHTKEKVPYTAVYLNGTTLTPLLNVSEQGKPDRKAYPHPDELYDVLSRMGIAKVPLPPFSLQEAPEEEYPLASPAMVFRTGTVKSGDNEMIVIRNDKPGERDIAFTTKAAQDKTKEGLLYMSFAAQCTTKEGMYYLYLNTKTYHEGLAFGFDMKSETDAKMWEQTVGPALVEHNKFVIVGSVDWKNTTKNGVNNTLGDDGGMELDGMAVQEANGQVKGLWILHAAIFVDFHEFLDKCGIVCDMKDAYEQVFVKENRNALPAYTAACSASASTYGVMPVNGGNSKLEGFFEKNKKDHGHKAETFGKCVFVPPGWGSMAEHMIEPIAIINAALRAGKITSADVLKWYADGSVPDKKEAKAVFAEAKIIRPKSGVKPTECMFYVRGRRSEDRGFSFFFESNGYLNAKDEAKAGEKRKADGKPKKAKEEEKPKKAKKEEKPKKAKKEEKPKKAKEEEKPKEEEKEEEEDADMDAPSEDSPEASEEEGEAKSTSDSESSDSSDDEDEDAKAKAEAEAKAKAEAEAKAKAKKEKKAKKSKKKGKKDDEYSSSE